MWNHFSKRQGSKLGTSYGFCSRLAAHLWKILNVFFFQNFISSVCHRNFLNPQALDLCFSLVLHISLAYARVHMPEICIYLEKHEASKKNLQIKTEGRERENEEEKQTRSGMHFLNQGLDFSVWKTGFSGWFYGFFSKNRAPEPTRQGA